MNPFILPHRLKNSDGFTLIEVVITLLLLGVIGAIIARPLINLIETRQTVSDATARQVDIDYALTRMSKEIRLSDDSESVACNADALEIGGQRYELDAGDLLLNGAPLVDDVDQFTCERLQPSSLRLYQLSIDDARMRAFKRDPQ